MSSFEAILFYLVKCPWDPSKWWHTSIVHNFLLPHSIPYYWCTTFCLTIHPFGHLFTFLHLLQINLVWAIVYRLLCVYKFSFLWDKYPRMKFVFFCFHFSIMFMITHWIIFMTIVLKYLSNKSNICVILLASVDWFLSFKLKSWFCYVDFQL